MDSIPYLFCEGKVSPEAFSLFEDRDFAMAKAFVEVLRETHPEIFFDIIEPVACASSSCLRLQHCLPRAPPALAQLQQQRRIQELPDVVVSDDLD